MSQSESRPLLALIQSTLKIGQTNDRYEQEADRVAEQVTRMPEPDGAAISGPASPRVQRACHACEEELSSRSPTIQRMDRGYAEALHRQPIEAGGERAVRAKEVSGSTRQVTPDVQAQINNVRGGGQPLPESVRHFFERRFDTDFSGVRVHTGGSAALAAQAVNARAFALGRDVVFGAGQFAPHSFAGRRILAHELAHVVQQRNPSTVSLQRQSCRPGEGPPGPEPPVQGEAGPHPLVYRGVSARRSRRPSVGDAQVLLNRFLKGLSDGSFACNAGADLVAINRIRATLNQDPLEVDCRFGPNTEAATLMFQRCVFPNEPGQWDGKIGSITWPELETLRSTGPPPPSTPPPSPPPPTPPPCTAVPPSTPGTCPVRHTGYCAAASCFPTNRWLPCACTVSRDICRAVDGFMMNATLEGVAMAACVASTAPFARLGDILDKGSWFLSTNRCIWGHWRKAFDAIHNPTLPVLGTLTPEWAAAVSKCRSSGIASKDCCDAHVKAEQHAIDLCGPYDSTKFGKLPTDVPGAPVCSFAGRIGFGGFTGDFANVADRIKFGKGLCCP